MTSSNGQKTVRTHSKKPGKIWVKYMVMIRETSLIDHIQTHGNHIGSKLKRAVPVNSIRPSKQVITIVWIQ